MLDADLNGVWVDEADLASHFGTNAAQAGSPQPVAADATPLFVATVPTTHPPSAFSEWCQLGFDPVVSAALVACSASTVDLATPHPLTTGEVLSNLQPWVGSLTSAVTAIVANSALDSAESNDPSRSAPTAAATLPPQGGPSHGGPPPTIGGLLTKGAPHTLTRAGLDAVGQACGDGAVPGPPSACGTAQEEEMRERERQMGLLLDLLPQRVVAQVCDFSEIEWDRVPVARRRSILTKHLCSYSPGTLSSCRRALTRLGRWLESNGFSDLRVSWECSGGLLSWFVQDEQAKSRSASGGATVPAALRSGLVFAAKTLTLPLKVDVKAFVNVAQLPGKSPTPALATTIRMLYHFVHIATTHEQPVVCLYASGLVLAAISALRLRDCQRATIQLRADYLVGSCFTSKHPKRRQPVVMPFFAPLISQPLLSGWWAALPQGSPVYGGSGPDFIFPRLSVPRAKTLDHPKVVRLPGPAKSADVIKAMRWILTLPPLSLDAVTARRYSGHSLRHLIPTVARILGFSIEERNELARWAAAADRSSQRNAMPNVYASEAECDKILGILNRLVARLHEVVQSMGGHAQLPATGGWSQFAAAACDDPLTAAVVSDDDVETQVGAEASSSESSDDDLDDTSGA